MNRRVVFDTGVLVSAALRAASIPHKALLHAQATCEVCASLETLAELDVVLDREKFDGYLNRQSRRDFAALMRRSSRLFVVDGGDLLALDPACSDSKDDKFLALAVASEASVLISSDAHLLVMHPWRGMEILTPGEFLSLARSS